MSKPSSNYKSVTRKMKDAQENLARVGINPTQNPHASRFIPQSNLASPVSQAMRRASALGRG